MRLRLSREALNPLSSDELLDVLGAGPDDPPHPTPPVWFTLPHVGCDVVPSAHC